MTRRAFARAEGVNLNTMKWWCSRLRSSSTTTTTTRDRQAFLEVVVQAPRLPAPPDFALDIAGIRVHVPLGFDARELRRLVDALC